VAFSAVFASSTSHGRQCIALSKWAFEGLGLQVGVLIISSNWKVEEMTAKY
jgi:hypothetical protein